MASNYLVQWMQGPCTEAGPIREFSIISLKDIKEDYRYALECGRITMATYRFSEGQDTGTMHKLCKILGAGEETTLETEMLSIMHGGRGTDSCQEKSQTTEETAESDDITCIVKVEQVEDVDSTPTEGEGSAKPKYPPWEVQQEMVALLDENHQVKKENDVLRKKLAKAVDVMDLSNILETTIVNIRQKRITQPATSEVDPQTFGLQTVSVSDVEMALSEEPGFTSITSASTSITRPSPSRQTPPGSSAQQHSPRTVQPPNTFQQQMRQAPAQHSPVRQTTIHDQQIQHVRQAAEQQQLRLAEQQLRQVQQQQQQRQAAMQQQQRQAALQQQQQQQQRQAAMQQQQQRQQLQQRLTPTSIQQEQQTSLAMSVTDDDDPYIVSVQSLVDPLAHSAGQTLSSEQTFTVPSTQNIPSRSSGQTFPSRTDLSTTSRIDQPGPSGMSRMSRMQPTTMRRGRTISQRLSAIRQSGIGRRPRTPQLQSSYIAQGYQQLQRARNSAQMRSGVTGVTDVIDMPSTSTQRPPPPAPTLVTEEQETVTLQDLGEGDEMVELVPGTGVRISQRQLRMAQRAKGFSQYTRNLMMLVFTMKELSVCSVTGFKATGKGSENAVARPALDPTRVYAIIAAVQNRFPTMHQYKITSVMNLKLRDVRKTLSNKSSRKPLSK